MHAYLCKHVYVCKYMYASIRMHAYVCMYMYDGLETTTPHLSGWAHVGELRAESIVNVHPGSVPS